LRGLHELRREGFRVLGLCVHQLRKWFTRGWVNFFKKP
jgi:hypothetical protein